MATDAERLLDEHAWNSISLVFPPPWKTKTVSGDGGAIIHLVMAYPATGQARVVCSTRDPNLAHLISRLPLLLPASKLDEDPYEAGFDAGKESAEDDDELCERIGDLRVESIQEDNGIAIAALYPLAYALERGHVAIVNQGAACPLRQDNEHEYAEDDERCEGEPVRTNYSEEIAFPAGTLPGRPPRVAYESVSPRDLRDLADALDSDNARSGLASWQRCNSKA